MNAASRELESAAGEKFHPFSALDETTMVTCGIDALQKSRARAW
jgi:hypothetical protein